ncbi:MAG: alpha/beta hydrolase [Bacteroidota bacterium]|nr:alpha/beta hydrolase [Bacteroidota bacterium]
MEFFKKLNQLLLFKKSNLLIFFISWFFTIKTNAQSLKGITGVPDTSYTTFSAWQKTLKDFPAITIVHGFHYPDVMEKNGITYCTVNHRNLLIDAFSPKKKNAKLLPAVIMIHGGGWRSGNRMQHYPLAERLAHLGYVCFTPEYRLSTEALFPAAVYDIKAAIRWVKANASIYHIDTSKIVIAGFSAGGELAAFMGTTGNMPLFEGCDGNTGIPTNVAAVVNIDGTLSFVNQESGEGDDSKHTSAATYWFGYPKKGNEVLWEAASPLSYVSGQTPPTLFINSSLARMHAGRQDYIHVLDSNHIYSEVHSFKPAPHSFCLFNPWFEPTVKYIDDFIKKVFH